MFADPANPAAAETYQVQYVTQCSPSSNVCLWASNYAKGNGKG